MIGIANAGPWLVSRCLFPKGSDKHVDLKLVLSWPCEVYKGLEKRLKEISDLEDDEETQQAAKNEPEGTADG